MEHKNENINQYLITPMGSNLIDLDVDDKAIEIYINYPGISTIGLELTTNLSALNGYHFSNVKRFAKQLEVESFCGSQGRRLEDIKVLPGLLMAKLVIDVGPTGMYQNALVLRTKKGIPLSQLIRDTILQQEDGTKTIVALRAIEGTGEHKHGEHNSSGNDDQNHMHHNDNH